LVLLLQCALWLSSAIGRLGDHRASFVAYAAAVDVAVAAVLLLSCLALSWRPGGARLAVAGLQLVFISVLATQWSDATAGLVNLLSALLILVLLILGKPRSDKADLSGS
jgi:hypothetical protein